GPASRLCENGYEDARYGRCLDARPTTRSAALGVGSSMEIRAEEITRIIREQLAGHASGVDVAEVGTVLSVGDGIARIHGLERCMAGELLELPHGVVGLALNLEEDSVGAVLMGES